MLTRFRQAAVAGLALLTLASASAAAVAWSEYRKAERRLSQAFDTSVEVLQILDNDLRDVPGTSRVRIELARKARILVDGLSVDLAPDDMRIVSRQAVSLGLEAAEALDRGDARAAAVLLDDAIRRVHAVESRGHAWIFHGLSDLYDRRAKVALSLEGLPPAIVFAETALVYARRWAALARRETAESDAVSTSVHNLAWLYFSAKDLPKARNHAEEGLALVEARTRAATTSPSLLEDLIASHLLLSDIQFAQEHIEPSIKSLLAALAKLPSGATLAVDALPKLPLLDGEVYVRLADRSGPTEQGRTCCLRARRTARALVAIDPGSGPYRDLLERAERACAVVLAESARSRPHCGSELACVYFHLIYGGAWFCRRCCSS